MVKNEWEKAVKKECDKIVKKLKTNPHKLLWNDAMILVFGLMKESEEKKKLKKKKNKD